MKPATRDCAKTVFSGERWDTGGHGCGTPATIKSGGKWYCKRHSPEGEKEHDAKREARWAAQSAANNAKLKAVEERDRRAAAYPRLVEALHSARKTLNVTGGIGTLQAAENVAIDRLLRKLGEDKPQVSKQPLSDFGKPDPIGEAIQSGRTSRRNP